MQKIVVEGGVPLRGEVRVSGAKDAVLPILCAGLLADGPLLVRNVPNLQDVKTTIRVLAELGAGIRLDDAFDVHIDPRSVRSHVAPYELVKTMRASVLVLGPLLAKHGAAEVSLPGGCAIGSRPVDQHIKGMQALGAEVAVEGGFIKARADRLKGARVLFDMVSVGATENVLMAATLAEGRTVLENAAMEPEIVDLAECLVAMGARIEGAGTSRIRDKPVMLLPEPDSPTTPRVSPRSMRNETFSTARTTPSCVKKRVVSPSTSSSGAPAALPSPDPESGPSAPLRAISLPTLWPRPG